MDAIRLENGNGVCLECRRVFVPKRSDQKFDTPQCRSRYNNRIKMAELGITVAHRSGPPEIKPPKKANCLVCGKEFDIIRKGKIYCSDTCRGKANIRARSTTRYEVPEYRADPIVSVEDVMALTNPDLEIEAKLLGATLEFDDAGYAVVTAPEGKVWASLGERMMMERKERINNLIFEMKKGLKDAEA